MCTCARAQAEEPEPTPLQEKLEKVAGLIGYVGGGVAVALFLILTIIKLVDVVREGKSTGELTHLLDYFIIAVTIVVVAVPEVRLSAFLPCSLHFHFPRLSHPASCTMVLLCRVCLWP